MWADPVRAPTAIQKRAPRNRVGARERLHARSAPKCGRRIFVRASGVKQAPPARARSSLPERLSHRAWGCLVRAVGHAPGMGTAAHPPLFLPSGRVFCLALPTALGASLLGRARDSRC